MATSSIEKTDSRIRFVSVDRRVGLLALFFAVLCVDQASKLWATHRLSPHPGHSCLADTIRFQYALNSGGFLSVGGNWSVELRASIFIGLNLLLMGGVGVYLTQRWRASRIEAVAAVLLLAGGLGNLIDRVWLTGHVIDFLNVGIGDLRTGIFNVADMAIMLGVGLLLWTHRQAISESHRRGSRPAQRPRPRLPRPDHRPGGKSGSEFTRSIFRPLSLRHRRWSS